MDDSDLMKREWNERARKEAFTYIASWRDDWDEKSFFESGRVDFEDFVRPVLKQLGIDLADKTVLEVGAGVGRMTKAFAAEANKVIAADISEEMLSQGKSFLADLPNIEWIQEDATKLANVATDSVDFAFSYTVFHHMPQRELVLESIKQMVRCVSPSGAFLFHFLSDVAVKAEPPAGKFELVRGTLRDLLAKSQPPQSVEEDPQKNSQTWRGSRVDVRDALEAVWLAGGNVAGVTGWGTDRTWCFGTKPA